MYRLRWCNYNETLQPVTVDVAGRRKAHLVSVAASSTTS